MFEDVYYPPTSNVLTRRPDDGISNAGSLHDATSSRDLAETPPRSLSARRSATSGRSGGRRSDMIDDQPAVLAFATMRTLAVCVVATLLAAPALADDEEGRFELFELHHKIG